MGTGAFSAGQRQLGWSLTLNTGMMLPCGASAHVLTDALKIRRLAGC